MMFAHLVSVDGTDQELLQALDEKVESLHHLLEEVASRVEEDQGNAVGLSQGTFSYVILFLKTLCYNMHVTA